MRKCYFLRLLLLIRFCVNSSGKLSIPVLDIWKDSYFAFMCTLLSSLSVHVHQCTRVWCGILYLPGNGQDKQNVSVYRCLAAVWIILALVWLALLLNIGARIMEHFLSLKQPPSDARDEQRSSVRKQEEGLGTPENQPQEKQKEKGFFKIRMV